MFLIADTSSYNTNPNWAALAAHPDVVGAVIKATQGTYFAPDWFVTHWPRVRAAGGARYGKTWFRGAYHYLDFDIDGAKQADFYLAHVARAGGWDGGDILPIVDIERGREGGSNFDNNAAQVIAVTTAFANRVKQVTGRDVMLYGRGAMRDLGITSRMGCAAVWNPGYTATMPLNGLEPAWSRDDVVLWQYAGTNRYGQIEGSTAHGLPLAIDGFTGPVDLSVYVEGKRKPTLGTLRRRILGDPLAGLLSVLLLVAAALVASRFVA